MDPDEVMTMDPDEVNCPYSSSTSKSDPKKLPAKKPSIHDIPQEIIVELILLRLPVETLLILSCVSKSWHSLISNPDFIRAHLRNQHSSSNNDYESQMVIHTLDEEIHQSPFPVCRFYLKCCSLRGLISQQETVTAGFTSLESSLMVYIVGTSNGIVCLGTWKSFYFWNPSIRKGKKLPDELASDPIFMCSTFVFGYDESIDDYKLIVILTTESPSPYPSDNHSDKPVRVVVYSLNTNSWKSIDDLKNPGFDYCFANGKLHWTTSFRFNPLAKIISLDLEREAYGEVEQPEYGDGEKGNLSDWSLNGLRGYLFLCHWGNSGSHLEFWVMKEYGVRESWTKVVSVPVVSLPDQFVHPLGKVFIQPFFLSKSGKILFLYESAMVFYDPEQKSFTYPRFSPWAMDVCPKPSLA